ncbi:SAM-dependent methyltransferase [Candidatus Micrarchaeota archaeon]|nr:SAM-dependent methyltransferase [Candidatus Micrarchaeota archaeon]
MSSKSKNLWFTDETVEKIKMGWDLVSFDLNRTYSKPDKKLLAKIPLEKIKENFIYCWDGKQLLKLALFTNHFYKLRMFSGRPILEIDGLRMHLVKDFSNPMEYSELVVRKLNISQLEAVLDTCMGLGYTAIAASKKRANVTTCEISSEVLELAKWNPWSKELFSSDKIKIVKKSCIEYISKVGKGLFSTIIHDPPRFSVASDLYSEDFYSKLYSVSKPNAKLFHYVGSVGKQKGRKIEAEITKRLASAGWKINKYDKKLQGIFSVRD